MSQQEQIKQKQTDQDTKVGIHPANPSEKSTISNKDASSHTEIGGRKGPEPTRYGDWEKNGRCIDF